MRWLNIIVVAALVSAAAYVYKIKFDATRQIEQAAKLRQEIRRGQETVAQLRAEWARLNSPARIQALAQRHLSLRPIEATQFDIVDHLPRRPLDAAANAPADGIGAMIDKSLTDVTGSLAPPATGR